MTWQPILDADECDDARSAIADILDELSRREPDTFDLQYGAAGWALCFGYHALASESSSSTQRAGQLLENAVAAVSEHATTHTLFGGFPGVAWVVEHLSSGDDSNLATDAAIDDALSSWSEHFDLTSGIAGLAMYLLERPDSELVRSCLARIADHLVNRATHLENGLAWHTPNELLSASQQPIAPAGWFDLGMAHGIPGVIGVMARIADRGIAAERIRPIVRGAVEWLLAQETSRGGLPSAITPDGVRIPSRPAWCYGDLGVALALISAGSLAAESAWIDHGRALARLVAALPLEKTGIDQPCLCHGAFGNAHLFNRLYHATGDRELRDAARAWLQFGLEMRVAGTPSAGFAASFATTPARTENGLLYGLSGIALALIAATTSLEPAWDRLLLADIAIR